MKKYKLTSKAIDLLKKGIIEEENKISFLKTEMENCELGEETMILSIFTNALSNKKYFKEVK